MNVSTAEMKNKLIPHFLGTNTYHSKSNDFGGKASDEQNTLVPIENQ